MNKLLVIIAFLSSISLSAQTVQMNKIGRHYVLPCKVNGLELMFILDTGAEIVQISLAEANFMVKNGYLQKSDVISKLSLGTASGDIVEGTKVVLRTVEIAGRKLANIEAVVVHTLEAPLLLGQSALEHLGKVTIDYKEDQLIFGDKEDQANSGKWLLISGSFGEYGNAEKQRQRLLSLGFNTAKIEVSPSSRLYTVIVGRYPSFDEAGKMEIELGKHRFPCYIKKDEY